MKSHLLGDAEAVGGYNIGPNKIERSRWFRPATSLDPFDQFQFIADYALLSLVKRLDRVEGMLARLADDLVVIEHRTIHQNHTRGQTQTAGQHVILSRGFAQVLDQIGSQDQADVAFDGGRQWREQRLPALLRLGR
jgi:hypothetical protein